MRWVSDPRAQWAGYQGHGYEGYVVGLGAQILLGRKSLAQSALSGMAVSSGDSIIPRHVWCVDCSVKLNGWHTLFSNKRSLVDVSSVSGTYAMSFGVVCSSVGCSDTSEQCEPLELVQPSVGFFLRSNNDN